MDEILDEKTYETRTVEYASFIQRSLAFVVDIALLNLICFATNRYFGIAPTFQLFITSNWWQLILIFSIYYIYFEGGEWNATLGKQIVNIRVLNEEKRDIDYWMASKHLFFSVSLFFGFIAILTNSKKQTLADLICKIIVVNRN